jgi:transposase
MRIVGGLDVHRRQITFDYLDERSGQCRRGRIAPADRMLLRRWLATNATERPAAFAVEACTGWRFVVEELQRAGIEAHLAEPADTAAARGPKRRAKTDRPTRGICASCWPAVGCPSPGSRPSRC